MHKVHIDHRDSIIKERMARIKNKILVMSNKGGVGKSSIAVMIARALSEKGLRVCLLDADIHGPSAAKMTGIENLSHESPDENTIKPIEKAGIRIVSMGSIVKESDKALIWRGPIKITVIKQLLADFDWGDADYMIIDLPPGTGDEPLSICQFIGELKGAVIVTTGQKISFLDVSKAMDFLEKLNIKILSVAENMGEFICPSCGKTLPLFRSKNSSRPDFKGARLVSIPFDPEIMHKLDEGDIENLFNGKEGIRKKVLSLLEDRNGKN